MTRKTSGARFLDRLPLCAIIKNDIVLKERPLIDKEIRILKKDINQLAKRNTFQKRFLLGWTIVAMIVVTIVFFRLDSKAEYYLLFGAVVIYILIGVWVYLENVIKIKKQKNSIDFVLAENKAKSIKIVSNKYIELSEVEDEGVFYLFQIEDNKILSFGGQDYYPTNKFPSDDFEIVMCHGKSGELVLLEKYVNGNRIQPIQKITGHRKLELISRSKYPNPNNFTVIEGQIVQIESLLMKK